MFRDPNCWTLFLNTANFKGPVCFFTPYFWSRSAVVEPKFAGFLLDSRPSDPNKAFQMETQHVPAMLGTDKEGRSFARVAPTLFPVGPEGKTIVLHRLTSYSKAALWDGVQSWFNGGQPVSGEINPAGQHVQHFHAGGGSSWMIYADGADKGDKPALTWNSFVTPISPDPTTYGYQWNDQLVTRTPFAGGEVVRLPEHYRLETDGQKPRWSVVSSVEVPAEAGLKDVYFGRPREQPSKPYETPTTDDSCWKRPGPAAGPFTARLGDGSVITYSWYRFADQPALLNADLSPDEREAMQAKVELLHRHWAMDRDYLAPPTVGRLAELDPALIVQPPKGLEVGYVPIATRQERPGTPDSAR